MRVLADFQFARMRWARFMDGKIYELELGKDTTSKNPDFVRKVFYAACNKKGLSGRTSVKDNKLIIQAYKSNEKRS